METVTLATSPNPMIHLEVEGDTRCKGGSRDEITVQTSSSDAVSLTEKDGVIRLTADSNAVISVPAGAELRVGTVQGNGHFSDLAGRMEIHKIGGNLQLRRVGVCQIDKIYGNLTARDMAGSLEVQAIYGNFFAQGVAGRVQVHEQARGNLVLRQVSGAYATALGNATLSLNPADGEEYLVEASGNIRCTIPAEASAELEARSGTCQIRVDFPERKEVVRAPDLNISLRGGKSRITLKAKGFIQVSTGTTAEGPAGRLGLDLEEDIGEISEEINTLIEEQMYALEEQLNASLSGLPDLGESPEFSDDIDQIVEQARQYTTRAALQAQARAQAAAQRAQEKLARKLEKARRRSERQASKAASNRTPRSVWLRGQAASRSAAASEQVSDEERLIILKMLEDQKISLEEAERLLDALEGKES